MAEELEDFHKEFFQDVHGLADAGGRYAEDAFFELFTTQLVEAGELETADRASGGSPRGMRVDGYGGDPASADGVLSLIIADFNQSDGITTLTATEMDAIFKRLTNFLNSIARSRASQRLRREHCCVWSGRSDRETLADRVQGAAVSHFEPRPQQSSRWTRSR